MNCKKCGTLLTNEDQFCKGCGAIVAGMFSDQNNMVGGQATNTSFEQSKTEVLEPISVTSTVMQTDPMNNNIPNNNFQNQLLVCLYLK